MFGKDMVWEMFLGVSSKSNIYFFAAHFLIGK